MMSASLFELSVKREIAKSSSGGNHTVAFWRKVGDLAYLDKDDTNNVRPAHELISSGLLLSFQPLQS